VETPTPTVPEQPTTPSSTDTQKLVGHWEATRSGSFGYDDCVFYDTSNVTETYTKPYGRGIHFYADGTFKYVFANAIYAMVGGNRNLTANGVTIIRGKYNAADGKLYMTDMRSSYTPRANDPSNKEAYADRAEADEIWSYTFGDDFVEIAGTNGDIAPIKYYDMTKYPCKEQ
jgi:hypothetical protein